MPTPPIVFIQNYFEFRYQTNTGAAFSMFEGHTGWLAAFSALISLGVLAWGWWLPVRERGLRLPFGLILGGAVGNLIDRVRLGHVIDFIVAHWHQYYWPTFNVADSAVCVGMAWLILASFRASPQPADAARETSAGQPTKSP
jgi:signal peptidase II